MTKATPKTAGAADAHGLAIALVERETGIPKDTLRVWERRYGFPQPGRDAFGERSYSRQDVQKLRTIKRLIDTGHRPGKLVMLDEAELARMGEPRELRRQLFRRDAFSAEKRSSLKASLALLEQHQLEQLRRQLAQAQLQMGFARLITDRLAPLAQMVSDAVVREQLPPYVQRFYTELAKRMLYHAIGSIPDVTEQTGPRVLLASMGDNHTALELLMMEVLLTLAGCRCISLGTDVSVSEMAQASLTYQSEITLVNGSPGMTAPEQQSHLERLRSLLPVSHTVWAHGCAKGLSRKSIGGLRQIDKLEALQDAVAEWIKRG